MSTFLLLAAVLIVLSIAVALARVFIVSRHADPFSGSSFGRLMATQLLSTGGIAALLLFGVVNQQTAVVDIALILAVLAAFAGMAFVQAYQRAAAELDAARDAANNAPKDTA